MATKTRKTTTLKNKSAATPAKRRRVTKPAARRTTKTGGNFANFFVPLFLIACILGCLGFLGFMGYRTVTASEFFDVKKIDVRGTLHASKSDIEKIVAASTERSGVWNADLNEIKAKVEKLDFIKSVAVARVLPDGVRVTVVERVPKAVARLTGGDFWIDEDGLTIAQVGKNEALPPFVMRGLDLTDKPTKENQQRVKMYQKMLEEWKTFELDKRVKEIYLANLDKPVAVVEISGELKEIVLTKDNFGKKLKEGLEGLAGKQFPGIDVSELSPKWIYQPQVLEKKPAQNQN